MNETNKFKPAQRTSVKPLIGLFGESGGGKTYSALLLARGIVGPSGKIGMIDTENGRGSLFCDMIEGGYETLEIQPPFSPEAYIQAIDEAENAGIECLIVDSTSHEWTGQGGYLDMKEAALDRMAGNDWKKRDACKFAASGQVKPLHNKFVARLLRCKMPVILCFRAKDKVSIEKDERGKTLIKASEHVCAIFEGKFIYEMLIAGEVFAKDSIGGYFRCIKYTHNGLLSAMPKDDMQIGIGTGTAIAKWCKGEKPAEKPASFKAQTWNLVKDYYKGNAQALQAGLCGLDLITQSETLADVTEDRWKVIFGQLSTHPDFSK